MLKPSELIDTDTYLALFEASEELAIVNDGELMLHQIRHPRRGLLTALQIGDSWFVTPGDFIDRREEDYGEVVAFKCGLDGGWRPAECQSGEVVPFRSAALDHRPDHRYDHRQRKPARL